MARIKNIKLAHTEPHEFQLGYILLPVGYSYNRDIVKAKKGDLITFFNGGTYKVYYVKTIKTGSILADILCRMRYGITIKGALNRWKSLAIMQGHSAEVVSMEECLMLVYDEKNPV